MKYFVLLSGLLGALAYIPLWKPIIRRNANQNFPTWALWAVLDAVATASIISRGGNFLLPATYTLGSAVTAIIVLRFCGKPSWTWFETMITVMVVICLGVWYVSGDRIATIASVTALLIASIPQVKDVWKCPAGTPTLPYAIWSLANLVSLWGGKNWSVEERLYPVIAFIICSAIAALSRRRPMTCSL